MAKFSIMRQGIPFGPEVTPAEAAANKTTIDRGLAFVCYQSDLAKGFEFVQKSWVLHYLILLSTNEHGYYRLGKQY